jgi:hypothetical protein
MFVHKAVFYSICKDRAKERKKQAKRPSNPKKDEFQKKDAKIKRNAIQIQK